MEEFITRIFSVEVLAGIVLLVVLFYYIRYLRSARKEVVAAMMSEPDTSEGGFRDAELDRYARHLVLREVGGSGQQKLKSARVLVIGAGGLGSPVLLYLAGAGVGQIGFIDDDIVSLSNLQRQIIFDENQLGMPKVFAAEAKMKALNPFIDLRPYNRRFDADIAEDLVAEYDLVIDGTDSFTTRALVNAACVAKSVPLISGAISQWEGQVTVFDPGMGSGCYACLFPEEPAAGLAPSCAEAGVIGPLPGIIGSMMAAEAVKKFTGAGHLLQGQMLIFDALWGESRKITLERKPDCPVCSVAPSN